MHLVVDGMNVIGSRPDGWWRDREAASRRLVDRCERLVRADGAEVTVVFDGHPRDDPSEEEHTGVRVLYATRRGPDAADDSIVELVASAERSEELRVVTSDRELRRRVETLGATVGGATELLDRLDALGRRIDRPPVPPDSVARAAGVRVVMDSLSAELAGLLRVLDGAPTIVVNSSHGEMRRRFTIAHELGHLSLHGGREGSQMFVDRDFVFRRGQKAAAGSDHEEIQANMFAAEPLMPRDWLERDVGEKDIDAAGRAAISDDAVVRLARQYGVSQAAMAFRLANLGLAAL